MCPYSFPKAARWSLSSSMFLEDSPERCTSPFSVAKPSIPWWSCLPIGHAFSASPTLHPGGIILSSSEILLCYLQPERKTFPDRTEKAVSLLTAIVQLLEFTSVFRAPTPGVKVNRRGSGGDIQCHDMIDKESLGPG